MADEQQTPSEQTVAPTKPDAPPPAAATVKSEPKYGYWWGTGRRKASVARVRIRPGEGKFIINGREIEKYFTEIRDRNDIVEPLNVCKARESIDVFVNVNGGGYTGQAGAIRLGVSRALKIYDSTLEETLRNENMLSRDPRRVERKKYGQPGARKRFQFSKR